MKHLIVLVTSILCISARVARTAETLTAKQLEALPTAYYGANPELRVCWRGQDSRCELALIATFTSDRGIPLFNPFGDVLVGCPYQIVLTDSELNHVHTIFDAADSLKSLPPPEYWVSLPPARIAGRCFWRKPNWTLTTENFELPRPKSPPLPEGDYLLHLIVSQRAFTGAPFPDNPTARAEQQDAWKSDTLDRYVCRAVPVPVRINHNGECDPPLVATPYSDVQCTARSDSESDLTVTAILVNDRERWSVNPFLQGVVSYEWGDGPISIKIIDADGKAAGFANEGLTSKVFTPSIQSCLRIPKDGVIGAVCRYPTLCPPGKYHVTAVFSGNIWLGVHPSIQTPQKRGEDERSSELEVEVRKNRVQSR